MYAVDDLDDGDKPSKCDFVQSWREAKNGNLNVNVKMEDQNKSTDNFCFIFFLAAMNAQETLRKRRFEVRYRKSLAQKSGK